MPPYIYERFGLIRSAMKPYTNIRKYIHNVYTMSTQSTNKTTTQSTNKTTTQSTNKTTTQSTNKTTTQSTNKTTMEY